MKLLVLNGPNMNMLGKREPNIYGQATLDEMNKELSEYALELNAEIEEETNKIELYFYQSNHEGVLIDIIQRAQEKFDGIVYNPAAHTHYSIALRDAIASVPTPVMEVHLSDITSRESFRKASIMSIVCVRQFMGKGIDSYKEAILALAKYVAAMKRADAQRAKEARLAEEAEAAKEAAGEVDAAAAAAGESAAGESAADDKDVAGKKAGDKTAVDDKVATGDKAAKKDGSSESAAAKKDGGSESAADEKDGKANV